MRLPYFRVLNDVLCSAVGDVVLLVFMDLSSFTDVTSRPLHLYVSLMHTCFWKNPKGSSYRFCIVLGFEDEDSLENLHSVLFCPTKKRSV